MEYKSDISSEDFDNLTKLFSGKLLLDEKLIEIPF